jgi:hypothetical protein
MLAHQFCFPNGLHRINGKQDIMFTDSPTLFISKTVPVSYLHLTPEFYRLVKATAPNQ